MTKIVVLGKNILAIDPFEITDDKIEANDIVYPIHIIDGYFLTDIELPEDFTLASYEYSDNKLNRKINSLPENIMPNTVSPRQIRQALTRTNLRSKVENAIALGDQDTKDWYEYATVFERSNVHVISMGNLLEVTDSQLDDLWRLAGSL